MEHGRRPPPEGIRLLSHRPSVLAKLLPLTGGGHAPDFDFADEGLVVEGPDWQERLTRMLATLPAGEREELYAVWLADELALPLPVVRILDRARTAWFPHFLTRGRWLPSFRPVADLATGRVEGHEVVMRGCLDDDEMTPAELVLGAEAHDSIHVFDRRSRMVALEVGLPTLAPGELLFVPFDSRAVVDLESSLNATWPTVARHRGPGAGICLQLSSAHAAPDLGIVAAVAGAHRERGALIALHDFSGAPDSLACLEAIRPDFATLDPSLTGRIRSSPARRVLISSLVALAHERGARVVADGIEGREDRELALALGVDCGTGGLLGSPAPAAGPAPVVASPTPAR